MKTVLAAAFVGLFGLTACESGMADNLTRFSETMSVLPRAADREGLYAVRDISGSILVQYFPGQVRESEILRRLQPYCTRNGGGTARHSSSPTVRSEATLANGSVVSTRTFVAQCI